MKGFMHIVEIILVVIMMFFVFTQFSSIPGVSTDWSGVKLKTIGTDMLSSLELRGVDWFNESELKDAFSSMLPINIIYDLRLENVIKPRIRIGCLCSEDEFNELVSILSPGWFVINEENVTFEVTRVGDIGEIFSMDFDVSLFFNYEDLEPHETPLRNFLSYDKGIVEVFDPENMDSVQNDIFGLRFSTSNSNSNSIPFSGESKIVGNEVYRIRKYFYHIPVFYDDFGNLNQWATKSGSPVMANFGDGKSVRLTGSDCGSTNTWIYTNYDQFYEGEINLDVYIEDGVFNLNFRLDPSTEESYLASFSTDPSLGYDAFYLQSGPGISYMGYNVSHTTTNNEWHRMKIVTEGTNFKLYNDGKFVASASHGSYAIPGSIGMFNRCGEAYADNVRTTFKKDYEFQNFLGSGENVTQLDSSGKKILLIQDSGVSAAVINYDIQEGKGRTVWLSGGGTGSEERRTLIKSLIAWAAGNRYEVLKGDVRSPVVTQLYKTFNRDMLQEAKIVLSLGYLY